MLLQLVAEQRVNNESPPNEDYFTNKIVASPKYFFPQIFLHLFSSISSIFYFISSLFDFVLLEQHSLSHDGIKLDQRHFVWRVVDVFARRVKESRPRRAQQLDGNGLALSTGHELGEC